MTVDDSGVPQMFNTKQVMEKLQISHATLLRYVKKGQLKAYRIGKQLKFKEGDINAFIESREIKE